MATERQAAANRLNALKSTGPKTLEGKARAKYNAVKHGLAGTTTALFAQTPLEGEPDPLETRKERWASSFRPVGPEEDYLFDQVVAESIRVERCRDAYIALIREHAERARTDWDADRRREADEIFARIGKNPVQVARQLEATRQGADLKIELWVGLESSLDRHSDWSAPQRTLALDLLGIHPALRDAETPVDPDPASADTLETRRSLVLAEVERLIALIDEVLADRDANDRALAETSLGAEFTRPLQLVDRYERAASRRQMWAWRKLEANARGRIIEPEPASEIRSIARPVPPPAPSPRPMPAPVEVPMPIARTAAAILVPDSDLASFEVAHRSIWPHDEPIAPQSLRDRYGKRTLASSLRRE